MLDNLSKTILYLDLQMLMDIRFETNTYHHALDSLVSHTNIFVGKEIIKDAYIKLLHKHSIISDVLYTTSIKKDSQIQFKYAVDVPVEEGHILYGKYFPGIDTSAIYHCSKSGFSRSIFIHEQCHKFINHIFGNTATPYSNTDEEELYEKAVGETFI